MSMNDYGFTGRFEALATQYPELVSARVLSQEKNLYKIVTAKGEQFAEVSGKFRYEAKSVSEFPAVGDFVMVDCGDGNGRAIIHNVLARKSVFIRKAAGTSNTEQVVAANIDTLFLCMSLNNDFNLRRLERYLSIAWDSGASPVVLLTKSDLCADLAARLSEVASVALGTDILVSSSITEDGYAQILPYIKLGSTVALIGSSGVGKSTLINHLLGEDRIETDGLRNDDKGHHTTTHRELVLLPNGGLVIDTPGMRELGMWDVSSGFEKSFADIEELALKCHFTDCTHTGEPGCAIAAAIEDGTLQSERFESYKKLITENAYNENAESYLAAKEQKFKEISKMNKNNKKR